MESENFANLAIDTGHGYTQMLLCQQPQDGERKFAKLAGKGTSQGGHSTQKKSAQELSGS